MTSLLLSAYIFGVTCPIFRYELPDGWEGKLFIGDLATQMPFPGVEMEVIAWRDGKFFDALLCQEGERVTFRVPDGTYTATWQFRNGKWRSGHSRPITYKYRAPCLVCHE